MVLLVKVEDAAAQLAISRSRVYQLLAAGELESVHVGKSRRVPMDALEAFVERLRAKEGPRQ